MIWTREQVAAMEGYTFTQAIDMFVVERAAQADGSNPAIEATLDHLFSGLQAAGHTWAVEVSRDDMQVDVKPSEAGHMLDVVRMRWRPQTTAGLFIGGPIGGKVMTLDAHTHRRGMYVMVHQGVEAWTPGTAYPETDLAKKLFYEWTGWSETRRMWTYALAPKR